MDMSGSIFIESDNAFILARKPRTSNTVPDSKAVLKLIFLTQRTGYTWENKFLQYLNLSTSLLILRNRHLPHATGYKGVLL